MKESGLRPCVDYQALNMATDTNWYALSTFPEMLD
jgi:hypothetical protein